MRHAAARPPARGTPPPARPRGTRRRPRGQRGAKQPPTSSLRIVGSHQQLVCLVFSNFLAAFRRKMSRRRHRARPHFLNRSNRQVTGGGFVVHYKSRCRSPGLRVGHVRRGKSRQDAYLPGDRVFYLPGDDSPADRGRWTGLKSFGRSAAVKVRLISALKVLRPLRGRKSAF